MVGNCFERKSIRDNYFPDCWAWHDLCILKWIDKDRRVEIDLTLHVAKKDGMKIRLLIRQTPQSWATDYQWSRGLKKFRNGKCRNDGGTKGDISAICHEGRAEAAPAVVGCWWIDGGPLPIFGGGFLWAGSVV